MITCGQQPVFASPANTLLGLAAPDFNPRATVYLPLESQSMVTAAAEMEAKILRAQLSAHRVEVEVEAKSPALVVVAQTFYHPWRASIDGHPIPLLRANHAFQAVEVPAGRSRILLRYADRRFVAGAILSAVSALICLVIWVRSGKKWVRIRHGPARP